MLRMKCIYSASEQTAYSIVNEARAKVVAISLLLLILVAHGMYWYSYGKSSGFIL